MVSHLCDICLERYASADLARICESQETRKPNISRGSWVKHKDGNSNVYGVVDAYSVKRNLAIKDTTTDQVVRHELLLKLAHEVVEVPNGDNHSNYWDNSSSRGIPEKDCTVLSPKEMQVIDAISSKVGFERGINLPSIDFLSRQQNFEEYLK